MYKLIALFTLTNICLHSDGLFDEHVAPRLKSWNYSAKKHLPYDANRVRLLSGNFYNASYLVSEGATYIVAESPDTSSEESFWEVVTQENVRVILSFGEAGLPQKGVRHIHGACRIRCIDERPFAISRSEKGVKRFHIVTKGGKSHGVMEFVLSEAPTAEALAQIHLRAQEANVEGKPILLHSATASGPVGRYIEMAAHEGETSRDLIKAQRHALFDEASR